MTEDTRYEKLLNSVIIGIHTTDMEKLTKINIRTDTGEFLTIFPWGEKLKMSIDNQSEVK
jgi:hypothetical protein